MVVTLLHAPPEATCAEIAAAETSLGTSAITITSSSPKAFGDDDVIVIAEVPNDVSAAAISAQVASGGACSSVTTTQLLSMSDWVTACEKAKSVSSGYTAPSS